MLIKVSPYDSFPAFSSSSLDRISATSAVKSRTGVSVL